MSRHLSAERGRIALSALLAADLLLRGWSLLAAAPSAQAPPRASLPEFVQLAERIRPAVVNVSKRSAPRAPGIGTGVDSLGSGFVVSSDGYIATSEHLVHGSDAVEVRFSNRDQYLAAVAATDQANDVALLKIEPRGVLGVVSLAPASNVVRVGEWVLAVGNPFALEQTVTAGIISATGRVIGSGPYDAFLQTDAAINPGNSGGPLVNLEGEAVGINSAAAGGVSVPGIGFAVPIDATRHLLDRAKAK